MTGPIWLAEDDAELPTAGLADTSLFIAQESGRHFNVAAVPMRCYVSVLTAAELEAGLLVAGDIETRASRLATYQAVMRLELLTIDRQVTHHWAKLRVAVAAAGRRVNVNDMWIAATALANQLPVVTQDNDFVALTDLGGPAVILV